MDRDRKTAAAFFAVDFLGLSLTVLLIGALFYYALNPQVQKSRLLRGELRDLLERLSAQPELIVDLTKAEVIWADLGNWTAPPRNLLPGKLDFEDFYAALTEGAEKNRVLVKYVKPDAIRANQTWACRELRVSIRATAGFEDFHRFLDYLATLPETLIRLQSLTLRPVRGSKLCDADLYILLQAGTGNEQSDSRRGEASHGG